jgi:ABC-type Zn uptake system ZnuABC Zn-binding protein ZnuA/ABC-type Mn2+/Zn2+ transport system permease subunit
VSVGRLSTRQSTGYDSLTALVLAGALALGIILASDVFHSGAHVETLLFGSLLVVGSGDIALAAGVSLLAVAGTWALGPRWLAQGFDRDGATALGTGFAAADVALLGLVALAAVASLSAIGSLLAAALLVIPAATTRLLTRRVLNWQLATIALVAVEGTVGLWASVKLDVPPGAAIAVLSGAVCGLTAVARVLPRPGRRALVIGASALALFVAGCGSSGKSAAGRVRVVATTTQVADFSRAVGGKHVDVHRILAPNTDPHDYEPRPKDVTDTAGAKLVLTSGNNLDSWMRKVIDNSGGHPTVVDLSASNVARVPGESSGPEASRYDAHWWHDPVNAEAAVKAIRDALVRAAPKYAAEYRANAQRYLAKVARLDAGIRSCFATVPDGQRKLVTSHDAFNYFARRYGVTIVGAIIPSQTTQAQPSAGDINALVEQVRREKVRAIFLESSVNPKLAKRVAEETGVNANLTLYGDTLGPTGSDGATYLSMEAHNADSMVRGFTGDQRRCVIGGL